MNDLSELMKCPLSGEARQAIDAFLAGKKRQAIVFTLAETGDLSQGELAVSIDSTVTSLSNIIQRFEPYKLLEVERVGKYRRYRLSALGREYVSGKRESNKPGVDEAGQRLFQKAEESFERFKKKNEADNWELRFDDALLRRVRGGDRLDEESELFVDQYLKCIELTTLQGSYAAHDDALELLKNPIHRLRIESYMELFTPFITVIQSLQMGADFYDIYTLLKAANSMQPVKTVKNTIGALKWNEKIYDDLKDIFPRLRNCVKGYSESEIFHYFMVLLCDQRDLSFCMMSLICGGCEQKLGGT